ncbi:helix-turn-helix transcriptional regulator [Enterococcus sp. LJL90]
MHTAEIQQAITFIEANLTENLSLASVADTVGLSKFYFHRLFKKEVGIPLYTYIKERRLTLASKLLTQSQISILEIALVAQFDSQEAFSRAFKQKFHLPPKLYRKTLTNLISQEEKNMTTTTEISGWLFSGSASEKYQLELDQQTFHSGTQAALLKSTADTFEQPDFATILQQFTPENYLGKRVKFSAFIKADEVVGWAGLWMRMDGGFTDTILKFDNMQNRPIQGTRDWNYYFTVLDVPVETTIINIGILLQGAGKIWVDSAKFEVVDHTVPTTDWKEEEIYQAGPTNLDFEKN